MWQSCSMNLLMSIVCVLMSFLYASDPAELLFHTMSRMMLSEIISRNKITRRIKVLAMFLFLKKFALTKLDRHAHMP